ncbi:MAG: hypothetical protein R3B47_11915 [Bacteroidia bacterium]
MRKVTKSKGAWVNRGSILKQLYLALQYNKKSWNKTVHYWSAVQRELEDYLVNVTQKASMNNSRHTHGRATPRRSPSLGESHRPR